MMCSAINYTLFYEFSSDLCGSKQGAKMSCTKAEIGVRYLERSGRTYQRDSLAGFKPGSLDHINFEWQ
jgi:hypothetical protein